MRFQFNDGGRREAGYRGEARDCVTRSIAIAAELPYGKVYQAFNHIARTHRLAAGRAGGRHNCGPRCGVCKPGYKQFLAELGWKWTPTMQIGSGCKVHLRDGELPMGRLIVSTSRHLVAVIDGVIHDTSDPSREGMRCVYGYWVRP